MGFFKIPDQTLKKQRDAADPAASVWVSANAGSGKTHVLTQRVMRLLLQGTQPSRILCLTFTKAAAANMSARVFRLLAEWTRLDDDALRRSIEATGAKAPGREDLAEARRLFARTVETPGGLKIQTIHAFCERLLHLFPFEANAPARFEVADDERRDELLARARREALERARTDEAFGALVDRVAQDCSGADFDRVLREALAMRAQLREDWPGGREDVLRKALKLPAERDAATIFAEMAEGGIAPGRWPEIAAFLATGKAKDSAKAEKLRSAIAARAQGDLDAGFAHYRGLFFNASDDAPAKDLLFKPLKDQRPELLEEFRAEQARLVRLDAELRAAETLSRSQALAGVVDAIFARYLRLKAERAILDFDDLVDRTLTLLTRSAPSWVLYKLDAGVDHILVDEAQDTSDAQWRILTSLMGEFAVGRGANEAARTFFAVGDEKQSIFSFQGAAPHMFHEMRRAFETKFARGRETFRHVTLTHSFRSASGVLSAVDGVFAEQGFRRGLVAENEVWMGHEPIKTRLPALVEIWPLVGPGETKERRDWRLPLDLLDEMDPSSRVAERVAEQVARLVRPGSTERVHDDATGAPRPARPGDVLILARRRGVFFEAVIRALKRKGVPVAGADRLRLGEHIAAQDLVAAGRAALLPQDDLSLACALKSPLVGLDDDDLPSRSRRGARAGSMTRSRPRTTRAMSARANALTRGARGRRCARSIFMRGC
ncbi:UvrD-helicase domain-containing protein [Methylocella sp.]|uniref:UvrD-helicase domain-containing protein n=1 Tax=Methylocella sp. TaxID=1978226 RepID=UPI003784C2CC